jgi:GDP-4-dehydro-6-deoxy-D-mannose reductase
MKALVTGAGGFVGSHLVAHLDESGDDVVACDRGRRGGFDVTDRGGVHRVIAEHAPDVVYHLAALTHVGESWTDPVRFVRVNVEGTVNVLDACRAAGVARVVFVGSAEEYGLVREEDLPLREDVPLRPSTPYGASKVAASQFALQAYLGAGLETVRVRPFNHTGPGQSDRFLVPALARRMAEAARTQSGTVRVGALDPVRDISDVRDVVRAYRLLALHGAPGEVYNVCSGRGVAVADVADLLLSMVDAPLRLVTDEELVRPTEVPRLVGDPTKLVDATGWRPAFTLEQTLRTVLAGVGRP